MAVDDMARARQTELCQNAAAGGFLVVPAVKGDTLLLPKGYTMVLGFTDAQVTPRNAGLAGAEETMDWMFY